MMTRTGILLALSVIVGCVFAACSTSATEKTPAALPTPSPTPINPQALFEESGRAMSGLHSFRFRLEHENGGTPLAENLVLNRAEGTVVRPDRISIEFAGSVSGFAVKASLISIGDQSYMTNPLTGEWGEVPQEISPLSFFDPQAGIAQIMSQVTGAALVSVNDKTISLRGQIDSKELAPLFGVTLQGEPVSAEVVIDANSFQLLKATLTGKVTPLEEDGVVRIIRLSDFDEEFAITAPAAGEK